MDRLQAGAALAPCPFCGGDAFMKLDEFSSEYCKHKKDIPTGARFVKKTVYPSGDTRFEYRRVAYIPQCLRHGCLGQTVIRFKTNTEAAAAWNRRPIGRASL